MACIGHIRSEKPTEVHNCHCDTDFGTIVLDGGGYWELENLQFSELHKIY